MKKQIDICSTTIKSKKSGNDIRCVKVTIGKYSGLLFPNDIEMDYIDNLFAQLNNEETNQEEEEEIYS